MWVTNLEEIDRLTEKTQKRHAIDHASKLKNDVPLSAYQRVGYEEEFREKTEELLENIPPYKGTTPEEYDEKLQRKLVVRKKKKIIW